MSSYNGSRNLLVGVDVGGTKVAVLVVDMQEHVRSQLTLPTVLQGREGHADTLSGIVGAIREALRRAGAEPEDVAALAIGVPGSVDPSTGVVRHAVNLGWREFALGEHLSRELGVPCFLENDVRMATAGIQRLLGREASRNMAYVSVGTGIAAGLVLDGSIYRGPHGMAGEIGHMVIEPDGPRCACGLYGCLEALAAGPAIARLGEQAAASREGTLLRNYRPVTAEAVYAAARQGGEAALEITRKVGRYLALAIQQLVMAYDVELIVLGGGVSRDGDAFLQPILQEVERMRCDSALAHEMLQPGMIRLLPPDYGAGTWGAVVMAAGATALSGATG